MYIIWYRIAWPTPLISQYPKMGVSSLGSTTAGFSNYNFLTKGFDFAYTFTIGFTSTIGFNSTIGSYISIVYIG
jgi:hypothetical protein